MTRKDKREDTAKQIPLVNWKDVLQATIRGTPFLLGRNIERKSL